ncbi:hypothetical protein [Tateyamaria sp. Alg231-49]|uniref:hypothetical protein n=1 Tax=Tateyamaria sp. Alg231-49 TaxID=1922219 RepID=UPI000D54BC23|nr:hypothetical protein [Tateyamaria sp. Alg231-49]
MRLIPTLGSLLLISATGAAADGFTSLNAKVRFNTGEVDRNGTVASFDNDVQTSAHGVYELGEWTIFGGLETQRSAFTANGGDPDDKYKNVYFDLGGERSFGAFSFGGQLAHISFENDFLGVNASVDVVSAYGQYEVNGLVAGAGLLYSNTSDAGVADVDETGVLAFISNDFGNGLTLGAQATVQSDFELLELYADYIFKKGDVSFSLINTDTGPSTVQFFSIDGRYKIYKQFNLIGGILNSDDPTGDSTTELSTGVEYVFGDGAAARLEYVEYGAFNGFSGNGISFGLTYEIGKKRKSGYQPIGKTFADKNSAVFFTF